MWTVFEGMATDPRRNLFRTLSLCQARRLKRFKMVVKVVMCRNGEGALPRRHLSSPDPSARRSTCAYPHLHIRTVESARSSRRPALQAGPDPSAHPSASARRPGYILASSTPSVCICI